MNILREKMIWNGCEDKNQYVDFFSSYKTESSKKIVLNISCDNIFTFYVNGVTAGFGSCQNFPSEKQYYTFDVTGFTDFSGRENNLKITVWHQGEDSQTYISLPPYLMFNVMQGEIVLARSGEDTLWSVNRSFKSDYLNKITVQLGYGYYYDFTAPESVPGSKAVVMGEGKAVYNNIKNLITEERADAVLTETENGYISDLKKETVGFLQADIYSDKEKDIRVSYGEHLRNGKVPRIIAERDFSIKIRFKKGENKFIGTFRRIAGRYLETDDKDIKINYLGILPVSYPVKEIKTKFSDGLLQKIYDVSVYTLKCCMHEHYEDCPWREQALYNMDSRNQMLCGYYAFRDYEFQRANLVLMTKGLREDGLLSICFPSGLDLPIPFFSLVYPMQVYEYIEHTGDRSILSEVGGTVRKITETFKAKISDKGLIPNFEYPCWNFYEWNEYSSNETELGRDPKKREAKYDLILNCMYVYALSFADRLFGTETDVSDIKNAIRDTFFDKKEGLYKLSTECDKCSVLGNSLAILIGLGGKEIAEKLKIGEGIVPVTLSMNTFFYDALLKVDYENADFILEDIKKKYGMMLDAGATTFWETELGAEDFGGAGSLCHGWSAMPVYYLNIFNDRMKLFEKL